MNKQLIAILLVLSSCGFLGETVGNQLEHVKRNRRNLTPDSNSGPIFIIRNGLIILKDVYYPFFIGKKLGGQELGTFKEHIHIYCVKFNPTLGSVLINVKKLFDLIFGTIGKLTSLPGTVLDHISNLFGAETKSLKGPLETILEQLGLGWIIGGGELIGLVADEVKLIADDVCTNQEQVVEFAKHGEMACVIAHENEVISCLKDQVPKLFKSGYGSKKTVLNETITCVKKIFKACSSANQIVLNSIIFTVLYSSLSRYI